MDLMDQSTRKTRDENEQPKYNFKMNYMHEIRKQHLLSQFLKGQLDNTHRQIVSLSQQVQNNEVLHKRISRKNCDTKPFKCTNCTHTYSSKAALQQHQKQKHSQEQTPITQPLDQQKVVEVLSEI
ncbi:unnamed protein product [Paramecium sonneborni]|uniref:C2H2-type domain-containing protein n=1 Tax=Paramecium sonneborni TaxID=65129 RepID=A0A8S1QXW0_9CILI|nr:unnamed protein product [Paramecium sonneborni]CAD8120583.1 unnamed protein product [Paramecium sonneborni]